MLSNKSWVHAADSINRAVMQALESRRLLAAHIVGNPAIFANIQDAVDAAPPSATVTVDAGTYNELVTISKPLTLLGAKSGVDGASSSRGSGESIVRGAEIVPGKRSTGFYINSNDVTIDGFTVQENSIVGKYGAGVVIAPSMHGTHIYNNVIKNNIAGLFLANNSDADPALIKHNLFDSNNNPGDNNGRGIYTDGTISGGLLTGVVIDSNTFTNNVGDGTAAPNAEAAIGLEAQTAGKQFNITLTNNVMQNNGKGLLLINAVNVDIEHNTISASTDSVSAAIRLEGGNSQINIECNNIINNLGAGVAMSARFTGPNSAVTINQNNVMGNATGGLVVISGGYTGTLDATNNFWGSSFGPSGAGPGFGDSVVPNDATVAIDPWLAAPSDCAPPLPIAPRTLEIGIQADIQAARNTVDDKDLGKKLDDIIKKLGDAIDGSLWQDNSHLLKKGGDKFFDSEKDAAHKLADLIKNKRNFLSTNALNGLLSRLILATQSLVNTALSDASGGDPKKLNEANKELDKASDLLDNGPDKTDEVIDHLKNAWKKALEANK